MHLLRRMKAEAALLIALCDIGGVWPVMRVTAALTDLAVASVQAALRFLLRQEVARGRMMAAESRPARGGQRPDRARDGQDGRGRAELFQRHRPDRVLRSRRDVAGRGHRAAAVLRARDAGAGAAAAAALRRRLCVPRRSAAAAGSGLDAGRDLDRRGAALLRAGRADLGTRGDDQGAALRRRPQGRRGAARRDRAVRLAQASGFRGARRRPRHEAADADLSRPERDRGRGPQRQGRPRRHPRDRVLRPDPAIDRRRPASGIAGAADAAGAAMCWRSSNWITFEALRRTDRGL